MSSSNKLSLVKKLTISTFLMTSLAMIIVTSVVYLTVISFGKKVLADVLTEKTFFLQKAFTEPLWTYDQVLINEIGNSLFVNSKYVQTTAIRLTDAQNSVLFERTNSQYKSVDDALKDSYAQSITIDVMKNDQKIGEIFLSMTNEGYIVAYRKQLFSIFLLSFTILGIFTFALRYYFELSLANPMKKILNQVQEIEKENYKLSALSGLPHELEVVSLALTQAGHIIEKRNLDIQNHNQDLERLVAERTDELEQQMEKNLNSSRMAALGEMAAGVAHEINNPLTVIDLNVLKLKKLWLLKRDESTNIEKNVNDINQTTEKIQLMVYRIAKIIKGLKALSRDGNQDPLTAFNITSMLEDVKVLIEMKLKAESVAFEIIFDQPNAMAYGREVQVSQVLVNLIGNSIDAISELASSGKNNLSKTTEKWVRLEVKEEEEFIVFYITDSGLGIPDSLINNIMRPFFTTKGVSKGTGLGLSISRSIILEHGGTFEYNRSSVNTQFVFKIKNAKFCSNENYKELA